MLQEKNEIIAFNKTSAKTNLLEPVFLQPVVIK
jgi:hypothetical protein